MPPGWDYNPATWQQRLPIVALAVAGFLIAGYLALYQWRVINTVWEPFFGDGSVKILNSKVSHLLPFPLTDAFLGALGYLADAVTGAVGGRTRWRTMPWIVIIFGLLVGPLGAISILLVILQPVMFDAFCTLCLATAVISVLMIGPAMDEFLASLQYIKRVRAEGRSGWRAFWGLDGRLERPSQAGGGAAVSRGGDRLRQPVLIMWARLINLAVGVWLVAAPDVLGYRGTVAADHDRIVGPILATFACVATWEVTRALRRVNTLIGAWLLVAPWVLGFPTDATVNSMAAGAAVVGLSLVRGKLTHRYGGGWASLLPGRPVEPRTAR